MYWYFTRINEQFIFLYKINILQLITILSNACQSSILILFDNVIFNYFEIK